MRKFAIVVALFVAAIQPAPAQVNGITAVLQPGQDQYMPGEDMELKVQISNRSGQPVSLGQDNQWIAFNMTKNGGDPVSPLSQMPVKGPFILQSGQDITLAFNPAPYFSLRRPGVYRVSAVVNIPQWHQHVACARVSFTIADGIPLPNFSDLQFGVPRAAGVTNLPPEMRRYSLIKITGLQDIKLYFRLTDSFGQTLRIMPIARLLSFSDPEARIDHESNFNVLVQTDARIFTYFVLDPNGILIARQTYQYTPSRPRLFTDENGRVFVGGGRRLVNTGDIPQPGPESAKSP